MKVKVKLLTAKILSESRIGCKAEATLKTWQAACLNFWSQLFRCQHGKAASLGQKPRMLWRLVLSLFRRTFNSGFCPLVQICSLNKTKVVLDEYPVRWEYFAFDRRKKPIFSLLQCFVEPTSILSSAPTCASVKGWSIQKQCSPLHVELHQKVLS